MVVNGTLFSLIGTCECSVAKVATYNTNLFRFCNKASVDTMKDVTKYLPRVKLYFTLATVFFISDCVLVYTLNDEFGGEILECGKSILICGIISIIMLVFYRFMYVKAYNSENYEET